MAKHPPKPNHLFVFREPSKKRYCPLCGGVMKYAVPSVAVTYIVHGDNDLCVIDNQKRGGDGATRLPTISVI
jgi:hypothetical protein